MTPAAASLDGHALATRYEALRQAVVNSGTHAGHGLALFMRNGMAAWMKSVEGEPVCDDAIPAVSSAMRMPEGIKRNLVDIVTSMALATALEGVA